jgi:hypothetical protein
MSVETAELRQLVGNRASVPKVTHSYTRIHIHCQFTVSSIFSNL